LRATVTATKTMVVSPHYLASAAGATMLQRGGNAFDAAVAVSACLAVVYPHMTGLGGDSFWLTYHNQEGCIRAYNGSGRSGGKVSRERFAGLEAIPNRGALSAVTVPGMVDSWYTVHREYGCLTFAEVLEPAIGYAEEGFPLSLNQHIHTLDCLTMLSSTPATASIFLPSGAVPAIGSRFIQRNLAQSLRLIAVGGKDAFYKGPLAKEIVRYLHKIGGLLTEEDFVSHQGKWEIPLTGFYRDYTLHQVPPNSQGFVGIMALQTLENFNFDTIEHGSYEYYHLLIEALKLAFRDRNEMLTDPDFHSMPLEHLLSKAYARKLADKIDPMRALSIDGPSMGSDTAYAAVIDEDGNAVSFIQSIYYEFGSGVVAGDTGILLQNRGSFFSLDTHKVNRLEPNKRTFHTLMPAMACLGGKPSILYGTQGGEGQPQTQTALLTRMVDYKMAPQQAVDEPRWVWGRTWGQETHELKVESRISAAVRELLTQAGHDVRVVAAMDGVMGHAHVIQIDENNYRQGAADPRCDGAAIGW
jgi:gamma-glutamyltranspeptidase